MALTIMLSEDMAKILNSLDALEKKVSQTYKKIGDESKKVNKQFEISNQNLMMAGASQLAFFWGVAQVSPVVNSMLDTMGAGFGAIFDVLFSSLMPVFQPLMEWLWKLSEWLQGTPVWFQAFLAILVLIPPIVIGLITAWKGYLAVKEMVVAITAVYNRVMMGQVGATLLDIKSKVVQTAATWKAALAARGLNMAIMAGPLLILGAVVAGLAFWWGSHGAAVEDNTEKVTELQTKLSELEAQLAAQRAELEGYFEGFNLILSQTITNVGGYVTAVEGVIANVPNLPTDVKDALDGILNEPGGLKDIINQMVTIQQGAFDRDLTPEEISVLTALRDQASVLMGNTSEGIVGILTAAGVDVTALMPFLDTQETVTGTWDFLLKDLENLRIDMDLTTQEVSKLRAELDALQNPKISYVMDPIVGGTPTGTGAATRPWYYPKWLNDMTHEYPNDFIMQPGKGMIHLNPQDTVVGVKDPSLLGGGSNSIIINIDQPTIRNEQDMSTLADEISRQVRLQLDRMV